MDTDKKTASSKDNNSKSTNKPGDNVITDEDNETRVVDDKLVGDDKTLEEAINPPAEESTKPQKGAGFNTY